MPMIGPCGLAIIFVLTQNILLSAHCSNISGLICMFNKNRFQESEVLVCIQFLFYFCEPKYSQCFFLPSKVQRFVLNMSFY